MKKGKTHWFHAAVEEETGDLVYAENDTFSNFNCLNAVNGFGLHDKNVQNHFFPFRFNNGKVRY